MVFKSRKQKKQRKNKTKHFKNKHRHYTLKQPKRKSYRKTRHYYVRQHIGGTLPYAVYAMAAIAILIVYSYACYNMGLLGKQRMRVLIVPTPVQIETTQKESTFSSDTCQICLEQFSVVGNGNPVKILSCPHLFHRDCLTQWLVSSRTCPICRAVVFPSELIDITLPAPPTTPRVVHSQPRQNGGIEQAASSGSANSPSASANSSSTSNSTSLLSDLFGFFGQQPQQGGAGDVLNTIANSADDVDSNQLQIALAEHFKFLELTNTDYTNILESLKTINTKPGLIALIELLATKLDFECSKSNKSTTSASDRVLVEVFGTEAEEIIRTKVQSCNPESRSKLIINNDQATNVYHIINILCLTLINYITNPDLEANKDDLQANLARAGTRVKILTGSK
jgi:hypothetical protein